MEIHVETQIDASADRVWGVLGRRFAFIDEWSSTVERSRPIDRAEVPPEMTVAREAPVPGRETTSRALTVVEVLVEYSDSDRHFTFEGVGLPRVIKSAMNRSSVASLGPDRSKVVFDISVDLVGPLKLFAPLLSKRMTKTFGKVQADLKRFVERDEAESSSSSERSMTDD